MTESECAAAIRAYWAARGYAVNVRVESVKSLNHIGSYVRSDMVNGLPRGYRGDAQDEAAAGKARRAG